MAAVDERERIDASLDRRIGVAGFGGRRATGVDVEQAGNDLEIVLHPVMDLARQPGLPRQPVLQIDLVAGDGGRGAREGAAQRADFDRGRGQRWHLEAADQAVALDRALDRGERAQDQPIHHQPADRRAGHPHQDRQQRQQDLVGAERRGRHRHRQPELSVGDRQILHHVAAERNGLHLGDADVPARGVAQPQRIGAVERLGVRGLRQQIAGQHGEPPAGRVACTRDQADGLPVGVQRHDRRRAGPAERQRRGQRPAGADQRAARVEQGYRRARADRRHAAPASVGPEPFGGLQSAGDLVEREVEAFGAVGGEQVGGGFAIGAVGLGGLQRGQRGDHAQRQ